MNLKSLNRIKKNIKINEDRNFTSNYFTKIISFYQGTFAFNGRFPKNLVFFTPCMIQIRTKLIIIDMITP